ncbi:hypothetical protein F5Y18DRAFT_396931 [Xylariaceae sp. FL1019]|nr:hypothetical protein F5Y18DRAFT_396931 [Xylariaceae sp. FL1019]
MRHQNTMVARLSSALLMGSVLLALVSGECTKFNYNPEDHWDSDDTNPYTTLGARYRVTAAVNCTSELAQSQGGNGSTCTFHRYSMGLFAFPGIGNQTINEPSTSKVEPLDFDADTTAHIFSLVQAANPINITLVDFNETIVVNYTTNVVDEPDFLVGEHGYYQYTVTALCYNGTLSGCDNGDSLEGARIQICGSKWIDDKQPLLPPGQQQYDGYVEHQQLLPSDFNTNRTKWESDPRPTYAESAGNATVNQVSNSTNNSTGDGDDNENENGTGAGWVQRVNLVTLVAFFGCAAAAISL